MMEGGGHGTYCTSSTNFEAAEAGKGCGADGYVGADFANYHHLPRIRRNKFGSHDYQ